MNPIDLSKFRLEGEPFSESRHHPPQVRTHRKHGGFITESRRVDGILALSRALGDCDLQPHVTWMPDVFFLDIEDDDTFFIAACDGIYLFYFIVFVCTKKK